MKKIEYKIKNPGGIHARPVTLLVNRFRQFNCDTIIEKDGKSVNAKDIFALMTLGIKQNDVITITFDGEDEKKAAKALKSLLEKEFTG